MVCIYLRVVKFARKEEIILILMVVGVFISLNDLDCGLLLAQ